MKNHCHKGFLYLCNVFHLVPENINLQVSTRWTMEPGWLGTQDCIRQIVYAYDYYVTGEPRGAGMTKFHGLDPNQVYRIITDPDLPPYNPAMNEAPAQKLADSWFI